MQLPDRASLKRLSSTLQNKSYTTYSCKHVRNFSVMAYCSKQLLTQGNMSTRALQLLSVRALSYQTLPRCNFSSSFFYYYFIFKSWTQKWMEAHALIAIPSLRAGQERGLAWLLRHGDAGRTRSKPGQMPRFSPCNKCEWKGLSTWKPTGIGTCKLTAP